MKLHATLWLLLLVLLAGCSSAGEKQALYEISEFYGGGVKLTSGRNFSSGGSEPQGHYLAITLNSPGLGRHYNDLQMPASNCAYIAFNNLTPSEQHSYDYVKVKLQDSTSTHTYTFDNKQLQLALQAATSLRTLIFNIQNSDYVAAANNFNPAALGTTPPDSLPNIMYRLGHRLNPFTEYRLHGFALVTTPAAGKQQLVRLYISVPQQQAESHHFLVAVINPAMSETEHFLYGINLLN